MKPESLKLLQNAVANLQYILDEDGYGSKTTEEDKYQAAEALKGIRAAIFMETPDPSMKFNIYDFTDDDGGIRPAMGCVHHQDGFKVASDSKVLIAVKSDYSDDLEGKNIDRKGEEYKDSKYPKWESLFSPKQNEAEGYRINFDSLNTWVKEYAAEKKMHGKNGARKAYVKVGPAFFALELMAKLSKFMKAKGIDTLHIEDYRHAAACFAEDGSKGLIMPCIATSIHYHDEYLAHLWETKSDKVMMWEAA